MKELRNQLDLLLNQSGGDKNTIEVIKSEKAVFPFSTEGRMLAYLLATQTINYEKYMELHNEYAKRNQYLDLFDMAPRTFGETWGEKHILGLFPEFVKATKENISSIYPDFDGEFDLWLDGIRVEVKACRANSTKTGGMPLPDRRPALANLTASSATRPIFLTVTLPDWMCPCGSTSR